MSERKTLPRFHFTERDAARPLAVLVDNWLIIRGKELK